MVNLDTAQEVLDQAKVKITGPRKQDYGNPCKSFNKIANLWEDYLGIPLTGQDVAMMMVLFKVSRIQNSNKMDSYEDLIGYAALAAELDERDLVD